MVALSGQSLIWKDKSMSSNSSIHNVSKVDFEKMDLGKDKGYVFIVTATDESGHKHSFNMFAASVIQDANEIKWRDF
jgi:hypothetical protein